MCDDGGLGRRASFVIDRASFVIDQVSSAVDVSRVAEPHRMRPRAGPVVPTDTVRTVQPPRLAGVWTVADACHARLQSITA